MDFSGASIGVVGALRAFPLRTAARRIAEGGGRLHRGLPRGTTVAVFTRSLLTRLDMVAIEERENKARSDVGALWSDNGLMRQMGLLASSAPGTVTKQSLLEQSGLSPRTLGLLALFDAFEHDSEPFSFRDLILAKKYAGLEKSGATWHEIARSLHGVGPVGSLAALTLQTAGDRVIAEDAFSRAELDGQRLLPLGEEPDAAEDYFTHAEAAEAAGLFAEAAVLYGHCAAVDPSDATAPFNQGNCLRETGDLQGAQIAYATSLKRDPAFVEAWFNCADVLRQLGRQNAARQHLQRAISSDPTYADALYNLAAIEYETGQYEEAVAGWRRYLELDNDSDWAKRARAGISFVAQMSRSKAG